MKNEYTINVTDSSPYQVFVGGHLALTVQAQDNHIDRKWEEEWGNWAELQNHPKMTALVEKCNSIVQRSRQGMKGGGRGSPPSK